MHADELFYTLNTLIDYVCNCAHVNGRLADPVRTASIGLLVTTIKQLIIYFSLLFLVIFVKQSKHVVRIALHCLLLCTSRSNCSVCDTRWRI